MCLRRTEVEGGSYSRGTLAATLAILVFANGKTFDALAVFLHDGADCCEDDSALKTQLADAALIHDFAFKCGFVGLFEFGHAFLELYAFFLIRGFDRGRKGRRDRRMWSGCGCGCHCEMRE